MSAALSCTQVQLECDTNAAEVLTAGRRPARSWPLRSSPQAQRTRKAACWERARHRLVSPAQLTTCQVHHQCWPLLSTGTWGAVSAGIATAAQRGKVHALFWNASRGYCCRTTGQARPGSRTADFKLSDTLGHSCLHACRPKGGKLSPEEKARRADAKKADQEAKKAAKERDKADKAAAR